MVYRFERVSVQNIDFPLRAARLEAHQQYLLMDQADYGNPDDLIDDPDMAEDADLNEDVKDRSDLLAFKQGTELANMPGAATEVPARTSAARCPVPANVNFDDETQIEFKQENVHNDVLRDFAKLIAVLAIIVFVRGTRIHPSSRAR
eukprot:3787357-Heterocapsa_arctica.AAC.1